MKREDYNPVGIGVWVGAFWVWGVLMPPS